MSKIKERLRPISFYGHKLEDVIRAFMQTDPKKLKEKEDRTPKYSAKESSKKDE
ncbi:MAG: hypothetical protein WAK96_14965 [Desulfobaccales bacterium]